MRKCLLTIAWLALGALPVTAHDGLDEQIITISDAVTRDPHNAGLLLARSELHRLHGDFELALADIARAQALGTVTSGVDRWLARVLLDQRRYTESFQAFSRHLAVSPHDGDARASRSRCAIALGDTATAIADLEAACQLLHQPDPDLLCQLSELLHVSGRTDEALSRLDVAITRDGDIPAYHERALAIERADRRHAAALKRLQHLAAGNGQIRWRVELGDLLGEMQRHDEARAAYRDAARVLDALPSARRQVAANLELRARLERSLARLESASTTDPESLSVGQAAAVEPTTQRNSTP